MNSYHSYLKYLFSTLGIMILPAILLAVVYEPFSGDLTRLGALDENNYGWNSNQPVQKIYGNPTTDSPDVLVIGDSFSYGNIWQSYIKEAYGIDFITIRWENFKRSKGCSIKATQSKFSSIKLVLFQTVEMGVLGHLNDAKRILSESCTEETSLIYKKIDQQTTESSRNKDGLIKDPIFLYKMLLNTLKPYKDSSLLGKTYRLKLNNNQVFSHKKSEYGLFYRNEINEKKEWTPDQIKSSIKDAAKIKKELQGYGLNTAFLVIPDKSTTYRQMIVPKDILPMNNFWETSKLSGDFINILEDFQALASTKIDFYLPNDTHLSTAGYQHLGELIYKKGLENIIQ